MQHDPLDPHIPDVDLMSAIDGELPAAKAEEVRRHLAHCWKCRARVAEREQAIAAFLRLQRERTGSQIPPIDAPAARLRAHLAQMAEERPQWEWRRHAASAATAVLAIGLTAVGLIWTFGKQASAASLPDARLTPGATRFISREQVCQASLDDADHAVPTALAHRVFQEYGIRPRPKAYEVDYLITPSLGGAEDIRNLWPQPYDGVWTARVKDALEDYLRSQVCSGKADLATVQYEIASNWIAAYKKHFHTNRPLPAHGLFVKDQPWE